MKVQILGTGCPKCTQLAENAKQAISESGSDAEVEKITDIGEIMRLGVMITPALLIDGQIKSSGKVLSVDKIKQMLV